MPRLTKFSMGLIPTGNVKAPAPLGSVEPSAGPPSRRRRLVGRGRLSLSTLLDPAWIAREQQRVQQQRQQQMRQGKQQEGKDQLEGNAIATVIPGDGFRHEGGEARASGGASALASGPRGGYHF